MTTQTEPISKVETLTIAESGDTSGAFQFGNRRLAELRIEGASNLDGSLGIQTATDADGTFTWLREPNSDGGRTKNTIFRIETPLAGSSYPLPAELCVGMFVRFKSFTGDADAASPTEQTQTAARALKVVLKS